MGRWRGLEEGRRRGDEEGRRGVEEDGGGEKGRRNGVGGEGERGRRGEKRRIIEEEG